MLGIHTYTHTHTHDKVDAPCVACRVVKVNAGWFFCRLLWWGSLRPSITVSCFSNAVRVCIGINFQLLWIFYRSVVHSHAARSLVSRLRIHMLLEVLWVDYVCCRLLQVACFSSRCKILLLCDSQNCCWCHEVIKCQWLMRWKANQLSQLSAGRSWCMNVCVSWMSEELPCWPFLRW